MPYVEPWDETTPSDTDLASQGDDRIREFKRAISERLASFLIGWPDTDPLQINVERLSGLPTNSATIKTGLIAERPNPPDTDFYYATDENKLYVREVMPDPEPAEWVPVVPTAAQSTNRAGSWQILGYEVGSDVTVRSFGLRGNAETDAAGLFTITYAELSAIFGITVGATTIRNAIVNARDTDVQRQLVAGVVYGVSSLSIRCLNATDGLIYASGPIFFELVMWYVG